MERAYGQRVVPSALLARALPHHVVNRILGDPSAGMLQADKAVRFKEVVLHFNKWSPSTVDGARTVLQSLASWADAWDWDVWSLSPGQVATFVREREKAAVERAVQKRLVRSPVGSPTGPPHKLRRRENDGSTVATTLSANLTWLARRGGLGIVVRLESSLLGSSGYSPLVKGQVVGFLAMARACLRFGAG